MTRTAQIVSVAREVLETDGLEAVTMRRLADELGIKAPSLYKHVKSRDEILAALQTQAVAELGELLKGGAPADRTGMAGVAARYRAWALQHPALYNLMMRQPLDRERLPSGLEAEAESPVLALAGGDRARARALWAVAHGLVDLELAGRFPPDADIDAAWDAAIDAFERGTRHDSR